MKRNSLYKGLAVSVALSAVLTGCGSTSSGVDGGDNNGDSNVQKSISGKAIDGYLQNAVVCLDLNQDGYCQASSEPLTTTLADGSFRLDITPSQRENENFDEAMLLIFGGVDVDTGKDFTGKLMAPNDGSAMLNISPITTLVAKNVQKALKEQRSLTREQIKEKITQARKKVADALEIEEDEIGFDPVERKIQGDDKLIRKSLKIQKSIEALLIAAQASDSETKDKIEDIYASLADGLDDMGELKGLDKLFEKAAQKDLFKETLRGQSPGDMLRIAKKISANLDDAFEDEDIDDDLEKIAAITRDDMEKIREGAKGGDLSTAIEGIVYLPTNDWLKKYIEQDLLALGIKPTPALVNKLKAVYRNDTRAGVLLNKSEKLKDNADAELKALYQRILYMKQKAEKEKEAQEAKYSNDIIKIETPMSLYNLSHHDNGYEKITFTADNKLVNQEYKFDTTSGTFVEDTKGEEDVNYVLVNGAWTNDAIDTISIDEKGVVSRLSYGQKAALSHEKDLSQEGFFLPFLEDKVAMPVGAKGYMIRVDQVKDNFSLDNKEGQYSTISDFIAGQCGEQWFDSFDSGDFQGGISFSGEKNAQGQYVCDPTKTSGSLSEVVVTADGNTRVKEDSGKWKVITLPETEQKALLIEPYNDARYGDKNNEKRFFTTFDDGSGKTLWRGTLEEKGATFAFPVMNKIAMDALIASTIKSFQEDTLSNPYDNQFGGSVPVSANPGESTVAEQP